MHGCFQIAFISGQFTSFPLSRLCKGQVYTVQDLTMGQRQSRRKISIGCWYQLWVYRYENLGGHSGRTFP